MGGKNAIAVRATNGGWEIIQYTTATLVGENEWELSGLLRGQLGTEIEAAIGCAAGADVVVLNEAVEAIANSENEKGRTINWMYGRSSKAIGDQSFVKDQSEIGIRGEIPYRPAHLRATKNIDGSIDVNWIRRNRLAADNWESVEIPMSESAELYAVQLVDDQGREQSLTTATPNLKITSSQLSNWFGSAPQALSINVAQVSASTGPGATTQTFIQI